MLRLSALRGLFSAVIEDQVTFVNAPSLAAERGVEASIAHGPGKPEPPQRRRRAGGDADGSTVNVAGTLSGPQQVEKIVQINERNLDLRAEGVNLIVNYSDVPERRHHRTRSAVPGSTSSPRNSARTPTATARRSCCEWTARCPATYSPRSAPTSAPRRWNRWTCREIGRHRRRRHRTRGRRRGARGARRGAPGWTRPLRRRRRRYHATGRSCPTAWSTNCAHDAILLGAIGDPSVPKRRTERGLLLRMRFELDHHVNLRPSKLHPGSPARWARPNRLPGRPRGHGRSRTPATVVRSAPARRTRWPPRSA